MSTLKVNTLDTESGTTITVTAGKTLAGTAIVDTTQIANDAITATQIEANAVGLPEIAVVILGFIISFCATSCVYFLMFYVLFDLLHKTQMH